MAFMPNMSDQDKIVLLEMLETGELCDLTITGNDESKFRVHSEVLSSVSKRSDGPNSNLRKKRT